MKEILDLQRKFDDVCENITALAGQHVLTGEALTGLQNRLGALHDAINELKKTCQQPPMFRKS